MLTVDYWVANETYFGTWIGTGMLVNGIKRYARVISDRADGRSAGNR